MKHVRNAGFGLTGLGLVVALGTVLLPAEGQAKVCMERREWRSLSLESVRVDGEDVSVPTLPPTALLSWGPDGLPDLVRFAPGEDRSNCTWEFDGDASKEEVEG